MKPKAYKHKPMKIHEWGQKPLTIHRQQKANDYLKYLRVIRLWVKKEYGVTQYDLECFLFLYSEHIFDTKKFQEYQSVLGFSSSTFDRFIKEGWIVEFRKSYGRTKALYELSAKCKLMIGRVYKFLNMEDCPDDYLTEALYKNKEASKYSERALQRGINIMQRDFKERQRNRVQE